MSEDYASAWIKAGAKLTTNLNPCEEVPPLRSRPPSGRASGQMERAPEGPLGTYWEIGQPPLLQNPTVLPANPYPLSFSDSILVRIERYHLQAIARAFLNGVEDSKGRKFAVRTCLVCAQADKQFIGVHRRDGKGFYTNLQTCGSVWVCPVCAAKISERRRLELSGCLRKWGEMGGEVRHLIQTVRHNQGQSLLEVLDGIGHARKFMRNRKPWKKKVAPFLAGTVRALEVTYGENGWHAHIHELLFIRPGLNMLEWLNMVNGLGEIGHMWRDACLSAGMGEPDPVHGIKIQNGQYAAAYAAKWGLECEMTKTHIKQARGRGGYTPFDLLREYKDGEGPVAEGGRGGTALPPPPSGTGPNRTGLKALFQEYAVAFKGKRQLVWSEGLKALLGIEDASDEELAARPEEGDELGNLDLDTWKLVVKAKKRGELAAIAGAYGWSGVVSFIRKLR